MKIPKRLLSTKQRKEMWADLKKVISKLDKSLVFSEIYVVGSFVSNKKRPADIDITLITKLKHNNTSWPVDLVIVPKTKKFNPYFQDIGNWMKERYGKTIKPIKIK